MTVSEPQDWNMLDFDHRFVGECCFFELLFTGCWCCENCQINADEDHNDACLAYAPKDWLEAQLFGKLKSIHRISTMISFLFIHCTFLFYMESGPTHYVCPSVPDK